MPSLSPLERRALTTFKRRVEALLGARLDRVLLFGSRARGGGHEHSDLDVLVLARDLAPGDRRAVIDAAYDVELEESLPLSPLVRPPEFLQSGLPFARAILRDGVPL